MSTTLKTPVWNGEKFRQARLRAGVSLRDPRWPFPRSETRIPTYQTGRRSPSPERAVEFAAILGCDVAEFYDFVEFGGGNA